MSTYVKAVCECDRLAHALKEFCIALTDDSILAEAYSDADPVAMSSCVHDVRQTVPRNVLKLAHAASHT